MATSTDPQVLQKKLAFSILEFLQDARSSAGTDVSESLEVAIQCISDSFGVSLSSDEHKSQYSQPLTLPAAFGLGLARKEQIEAALASANVHPPASQPVATPVTDLDKKFAEYRKLLTEKGYFAGTVEGTPEYQTKYERAKAKFIDKYQQPTPTVDTPIPSVSSPPTSPSPTPASPQTPFDNIKQAEEYKNLGNQKLSAHQYQEAVDNYSKAIEFDPNNAIYYANRAAAYSHLNKHQLAIDDCNSAIAKNPNYGKAYSRLGLANFSLGKYAEAVTNYKRALELDPTNVTIKQSLDSAEKKLREASNPGGGRIPEGLADIVNNPLFQNLAQNLSAGAGAGAGAQGANAGTGADAGGNTEMPDVSQLLNNPALLNMAQNVMSQPGFSEMLNNPAMMNMAQSFMQNPEALSGILQGVFGNQNNAGGGTNQ
jgi:small glutamine-rich tetratricopeptide repeat-containing protein alpha